VLYLVAAKDAFISRVFLFNFVPWLYSALLFSHYYLPSLLAWGIFRREDKINVEATLAPRASGT
jgi:hypothetical protein